MKVKVIKSYTTQYNDPLILSKGDVVKLGNEEKQEKWRGWIWASVENNSGWIPKQITDTKDGITAFITENYSAKELNAREGDILKKLHELNGWIWAVNNNTNDEGWIPEENVENV